MKKILKPLLTRMQLIAALIILLFLNSTADGQVPAPDFDLSYYKINLPDNQQINIRLPNDIRPGDMISGTVSVEPANTGAGSNPGTARLEGVVLEIEGKQTKVNGKVFSFMVPAGASVLPFFIKTVSGEVVERGQVPVFSQPLSNMATTTNSPSAFSTDVIGQAGNPLAVHGIFDGNMANTGVSINNASCEIIAESPRKIIIEIPKNTSTGATKLQINEQERKGSCDINVVQINLSADKTKLLKGQKTSLTVKVTGLENLEKYNNDFTISLENQSPQIITFSKEKNVIISKTIQKNAVKNETFTFTTGILATGSGSFAVNAILARPVSKNPCIDAYYDCVKAADERYESESKKCTDDVRGNIAAASKCQAPLIKDREEKKVDCLKQLINCMKGS